MTGCKSEKQHTFEQQALVHTDVLYRFGIRLTGNAAEAADLVQEMYLIQGLTYGEISRFLGCPLGTVRSRLHRGRKLLHAKLHEEDGCVMPGKSSVKDLQKNVFAL